jgi:RNA-splicing ligase RtcB
MHRLGSGMFIPGSMATGSFIVSGLGNPDSYRSGSHGAGRRLSRRVARKQLSTKSLVEAMDGIAWNDDAEALLDEHPNAYKDIGQVKDNQTDLGRSSTAWRPSPTTRAPKRILGGQGQVSNVARSGHLWTTIANGVIHSFGRLAKSET